jgi:hypothetical protein
MIIEVSALGCSQSCGHRVGGNGAPEPGASTLIADLWVMRRMEPVPRVPSDPDMSHLASDDRPSRPIPSSLSDRFPQRPYYRFYYAAVTSDVSGAQRTRGGKLRILINLLADLGDLSPGRSRPDDLPRKQRVSREIHLGGSRRFSRLPNV